MSRARATWLAIAGLLLAFGLPELGLPHRLAPGDGLASALAREAVWWSFGVALLVWVVRVEKAPLASIGLKRPTWSTLGYGLLGAVALFASVMLCYALVFPLLGLQLNQSATESITRNPLWLQGLIFLRAGVVEEILYRGYPITRLEKLGTRPWAAALVSIAVFTAAHLESWGGAQLIVVGSGATILAGLFLWRRDLPCNMLAHALVDAVGFGLAQAQRP